MTFNPMMSQFGAVIQELDLVQVLKTAMKFPG